MVQHAIRYKNSVSIISCCNLKIFPIHISGIMAANKIYSHSDIALIWCV
jgi:hypothetical protein